MKKHIIIVLVLMLIIVGVFAGCLDFGPRRHIPYDEYDCDTLLVRPDSNFSVSGIFHSYKGNNNYLFNQEAKHFHIGNKSFDVYVIEIESIESYIGLNVTLECDYVYYDDECGKTDHHIRLKNIYIGGNK